MAAAAIYTYQIGFRMVAEWGVKTEILSTFGAVAFVANVFIVAPFVTVFRSLDRTEIWQAKTIVFVPAMVLGLVLGLLLVTRGPDPILLPFWIAGASVVLAFTSASPQSRGHQMSKAQQVSFFGDCPVTRKIVYMANNSGYANEVDTLLNSVRADNEKLLKRALYRLCRVLGSDWRAFRDAAQVELLKYIAPPEA